MPQADGPANSSASGMGPHPSVEARAEATRDADPGGAVGRGQRQMQHDATHRDHNLSSQFQETLAQARDLRSGVAGRCWIWT